MQKSISPGAAIAIILVVAVIVLGVGYFVFFKKGKAAQLSEREKMIEKMKGMKKGGNVGPAPAEGGVTPAPAEGGAAPAPTKIR